LAKLLEEFVVDRGSLRAPLGLLIALDREDGQGTGNAVYRSWGESKTSKLGRQLDDAAPVQRLADDHFWQDELGRTDRYWIGRRRHGCRDRCNRPCGGGGRRRYRRGDGLDLLIF